MSVNKHETVKIDIPAPNGKTYQRDIDVEIAPLIKKLNEKGFYTRYCCSGHEDDEYHDMYIMFACLNEEKLRLLNDLTEDIDEFFPDIVYRIEDLLSGDGVRLTDPTDDQIALSKILLKMNNDDAKIVTIKKPIWRYARYHTAYDNDPEQIEANHREVLDIFRQFEEALDNMMEVDEHDN